MTKQTINLGAPPKGSDGDTSRVAFEKTNQNFDEIYERLQAKLVKDVGGIGTVALTATEALYGFIDLTGALTGARVVTVPADPPQLFAVRNSTVGGFQLTFQTSSGAGVQITTGQTAVLYSDGANIIDPVGTLVSATVNTAVTAALAAAAAVEVGRVGYFPSASAPAGYIKANGAAVSRTTYAALFTKIGTLFGAGDGSNTFNVPDLRGEFIRGLDDGRGVDSGRVLGSLQAASRHVDIAIYRANSSSGTFGGPLRDSVGDNTWVENSGDSVAPLVTGPYLGISGVFDGSRRSSGAVFGARPRNVALLACIKY
ncbi:hypothetical protein EJ774_21075 [Pandoraea apista]|uniref:Phage tail collar domain-containing protein n=1 Tax=Pandoraea apista TaxID=93218 RepID=A0ABX9ZLC1_9BURK|nr:phage tail protein [Pandoraea apista]RSK77851.1 hypothetical protein EJE83_17840 [Pandoraea apista]RUN81839.1 hypothetical protein EJ774_21075 [Pandoraea apista]